MTHEKLPNSPCAYCHRPATRLTDHGMTWIRCGNPVCEVQPITPEYHDPDTALAVWEGRYTPPRVREPISTRKAEHARAMTR